MNQKIRYVSRINTGEGKPTFNDKVLHKLLESKQDFSTWIMGRIKHYGFVEGVDFIQFHNFVESDSKARTEYHISLDMAKELSMVERKDKGRMARPYFISI